MLKQSKTLKMFPVISRAQAEQLERGKRFNNGIRKPDTGRCTIEIGGIYYDIRKMTDEQAEMVWDELHISSGFIY